MDPASDPFEVAVRHSEAVRERRVDLGADGRPATLWERVTVRARPPNPAPSSPRVRANPAAIRGHRAGPDPPRQPPPTAYHRPRFEFLDAVGSVLVSGLGVAALWWVEEAYSAGPLLLFWAFLFFARGPLRATGLSIWGSIGWVLLQSDPIAFGAYLVVTWAIGGCYWRSLFG